MRRITLSGFVLVLATVQGEAQVHQQETVEPVISIDGKPFYTWGEYLASDEFRELELRCQAPVHDPDTQSFLPPSDCSLAGSNFLPQYEPSALPVITIPVVVHVLMNTSGTGNISDATIQSQIDILNEDFGALPGTPGASGADTGVRFVLATVDPDGNPTTGITRTTNNTWFNDNGAYWNTLSWDTNRYLNIYTNSASGFLGYVPCTPACGGLVGTNADRVVCLWSSFGRNSIIGPPYNQGRTATHEVGHYLGLEHTFYNGCAPASSCANNGDFICDTNPESSPNFGCPASRTTCASPDPIDNYMDYTDDVCMERFTPQQSNRIRCTLLNWRPDLGLSCAVIASATTRAGTNPLAYSANPPVFGATVTFSVIATGYSFATMFAYRDPLDLLLANGQTLLIDPTSDFVFSLNIPGLPFASTTLTVPPNPNACGVGVATQVVLTGPTSGGEPYQLTNAVDLVLGTL